MARKMSGTDLAGDDATMSGMAAVRTWDDLLLIPEDGNRHELIGGQYYVTPTPFLRHQRIVGNLFFLLRSYLEKHPIGEVLGVPLDVIFTKQDVVEPDLQYVSNSRKPDVWSGNWATGAPDLVVEIASKSTRKRDNTIKYRLYERMNVREYWTIDPQTEVVRVHRRVGKRFKAAIELSLEGDDILTSPLFPGLQLRLADIFKQ
jgi:Uma2 family endonuclease